MIFLILLSIFFINLNSAENSKPDYSQLRIKIEEYSENKKTSFAMELEAIQEPVYGKPLLCRYCPFDVNYTPRLKLFCFYSTCFGGGLFSLLWFFG